MVVRRRLLKQCWAWVIFAPVAPVLQQRVFLIFRAQLAVPIRELYRCSGQAFFNINLLAAQPYKTVRIYPALAVALAKGALQFGGLYCFAA
jgi:hypothetical protein